MRAAAAAQEEMEDNILTYRDFWDGEQGVELTDRQEEYLSETVDSFGNLCRRVVNIPKDRLELQDEGIVATDDGGQAYADKATDWWTASQLDSKQKELYEASLRDGNVGLIVDWDARRNMPIFVPNLVVDSGGTGLVRFHYDSDDNLIFASKRWTINNPVNPRETGKRRLTVYRPDLIERYEADGNTPGGWRTLPDLPEMPNPQIWTDTGTADGEPLGIPVIPFENPNGSELKDVITLQEIINHNLGTLDETIDFHNIPAIWFAGADFPIDTSTGKSKIPTFGPGQAYNLKNTGAAMGRMEGADIKALFEGGLVTWIQILALVKGWPLFMLDRTQQPPSGIALKIMEAGLVKQVQDKQVMFSGAWSQAFDMARKLHRLNVRGGGDLSGELSFNWVDPATTDELTHFEALEKKFTAGQIPRLQRWREMGYTQPQIDQMISDAQREDEFGMVDVIPAVEQ